MIDWPRHPALYGISTWPRLREMSVAAAKRITLADVPQPELERIAALGFDQVPAASRLFQRTDLHVTPNRFSWRS
jgi:hypothetical protein